MEEQESFIPSCYPAQTSGHYHIWLGSAWSLYKSMASWLYLIYINSENNKKYNNNNIVEHLVFTIR